jgi:hypothetical protein
MVYVSGACCLGEAHLKRIERSYQTIFQVSFIITTEENSKQNFSPSLSPLPFTRKTTAATVLLLSTDFIITGSLSCYKKNRFSAVKFSEITLEMVFEF